MKRSALLRMSKRTVLVALVTGMVFVGAGFGLLSNGPLLESDQPEPAIETPNVPEPTVTPPGTDTAPSTPTEGAVTDAKNEPTETDTGTPAATATSTASRARTPTATETDRPDLDPSMSVAISDPANVANPDGVVSSVHSTVSGALSWFGSVDSVVVVVQTRTPTGNWAKVRRVVVGSPDPSLDLGTLLGDTELVGEGRASAFDNPEEATTVDRTGAVAVTAVFFEDEREVDRTSSTATYEFGVTNEGGLDVGLSGGDADRRFAVSDAAPGASGARTYAVSTGWRDGGTVRLLLEDLAGAENGVAQPERAVDSDEDSELLDALELRVTVVDGESRTFLAGDSDSYVSIRNLNGASLGSFELAGDVPRQVVVEWRLPAHVGNEVMTDSVRFDLTFELTGDES